MTEGINRRRSSITATCTSPPRTTGYRAWAATGKSCGATRRPSRGTAAAASDQPWGGALRRPCLSGNDRCQPGGAGRDHRQGAVAHPGGRLAQGLLHDPRAAGSRGKIMVGSSGGEYGIRGFVAAFDAETGKEAWRTYTIPPRASPAVRPGRRVPTSMAEGRCGLPGPTMPTPTLPVGASATPAVDAGHPRR